MSKKVVQQPGLSKTFTPEDARTGALHHVVLIDDESPPRLEARAVGDESAIL
jgi:hypothetical protein